MNTAVTQTRKRRSDVTVYEPQAAKESISKAEAVADYGAKVHDWPLVERAIEEKTEDQKEFVQWWADNVRGKGKQGNVPDRGHFVDDAEQLTGIRTSKI